MRLKDFEDKWLQLDKKVEQREWRYVAYKRICGLIVFAYAVCISSERILAIWFCGVEYCK